jgi:hypothetical protein
MKPITGTASITLEPVRTLPAAPPHTYLGVAQSMMPGVTALGAASPPSPLALALVAAHVLECLLKAYLFRGGPNAALKRELRKNELLHDLTGLWARAFDEGLQVQKSPPDWAGCLSGLHKRPYYLRYSPAVHGIVSPAAEPMTAELAALLETVRGQLT